MSLRLLLVDWEDDASGTTVVSSCVSSIIESLMNPSLVDFGVVFFKT